MKHTLLCLQLFLLIMVCCTVTAAASSMPMPTPIPHMQNPSDDLVLHYNPDGGSMYHLDVNCISVHPAYLPLAGSFLYRELNDAPYADLNGCTICGAPLPPASSGQAAPAAPAPTPVPVWVNSQPATDYERETPINMPAGDEYLNAPIGVTTWRGDSFRSNAAIGTLEAAPTGLEIVWTVATSTNSYDSKDAGFSWYSQPAIVQWAKELRTTMSMTEEARNTSALKEVIFASLDGHIYFLNLADGTATRGAIDVGYPTLSAVTVHPLTYPVMIAGQYSNKLKYSFGSIGLHWYELLTQQHVRFIDGRLEPLGVQDANSGAFNTSALIDRNTNTAVALSKDGYLYTEALDMRLIVNQEHDRIVWLNADFLMPVWAKVTAANEQVTSAPVMYGSHLWFGTSSGRIICVDTTTMQPLWSTQLGGTVYALSMEQDEAEQLWLYTGNATGGPDAVVCPMQLYRINAETGEISWSIMAGDSLGSFYAGTLAACVVGKNELDSLVCFTLNNIRVNDRRIPGMVIAVDKMSGKVLWQHEMNDECQSSPVALYDENGCGWIVQMTESGRMTLLDGLTGTEVASLTLEGDRWSSPAVYGDMLVIGSCVYTNMWPTGGRIYGVRIISSPKAPETPAPTATSTPPLPSITPNPITPLSDFMAAWEQFDQNAMLDLCAPSWKAQQDDPAKELFILLANRRPLKFFTTDPRISGGVYECAVYAQIDRNNGRDPAWYYLPVRIIHEDGQWWIDPESISVSAATAAPSLEVFIVSPPPAGR